MKNSKKIFIIILIIFILYYIFYLFSQSNDIYSNTALYPPIKPLNTYYIQVSEIHTVCYSTYGNINGKPVLFIHGGPGAEVNDNYARFFNPKYYYIILVDQRGCGKSTPSGELRENTTQDLISDFEKIRKSLNIDKWQLFGGSWGSTLSLAYAINHPEVVTNMILRGIFLSTPEEIDWLYGSNNLGGPAKFTPISWDYFKNALPNQYKGPNQNYILEYKKCFDGEFGKEKKEECLLSWAVLETSIIKLNFESLDKVIETVKQKKYVEGALIENYYLLNNCFLEPGYFFKKENIEKIQNIPTIIVQGRYDLICPPVTAYKLHNILLNSKIHITLAGHTIYDDENIKYLVQSTDSFL
jgi:proline iminopeptidase